MLAADTAALVAPQDDSEEADSDAEADAIIARLRRRRADDLQAEQRAAAEQAEVQAELAKIIGPSWGSVARSRAERTVRRRVLAHRSDSLHASNAERSQDALTKCAHDAQSSILVSSDWLWLLHSMRQVECLGVGPPNDASLQRFAACAAVCKAWRDAIHSLMAARSYMRHSHQVADAPPLLRHLHGFAQPTFLEASPFGELVIADNHRLTLAPTPSECSISRLGQISRLANGVELSLPRRVLCSGGSAPGQLYHPHGLAMAADGLSVFVADRSNHRVQCLSMRDGAMLDCTSAETAVSCPYGICIHRHELLVVDANRERVAVLLADELSMPAVRSFGEPGTLPGQLGAPRGIALWYAHVETAVASSSASSSSSSSSAASASSSSTTTPSASRPAPSGAGATPRVLVAELSNNRVSVFELDGSVRGTFGDLPTAGGALPLRRPFAVLHAHGRLLVSETEGKRLVCFSDDGEFAPLQVLAPPHCGGLNGLLADGRFILATDTQRGRVHCFAAPKQQQKEGGERREGGQARAARVRSPTATLRGSLLDDLKRMGRTSNGAVAAPALVLPSSSSSAAGRGLGSQTTINSEGSAGAVHGTGTGAGGGAGGGVTRAPSEWRNPAGPIAHFLRPSIAKIREKFLEGHVISEAELDEIGEENAAIATAKKAEVERLRAKRADGHVLSADEGRTIEEADAEKARIAEIAERWVTTWPSGSMASRHAWDPGRMCAASGPPYMPGQ